MDKELYNMTSTTLYLLPLLFSEDIKHIDIINKDFKAAYIADFDKKQYDDKILLVYDDYSINIPLTSRVDSYKRNDNTVLVYNLPDEFTEDYYKFLIRNLKGLSDKAKKRILEFWEEGEKSALYKTLYGKGNKMPEINLHLEVLGL